MEYVKTVGLMMAEGGSRTRTSFRTTDFKSLDRHFTTFYYMTPGSIYRRFSRQSKPRRKGYHNITPSFFPHLWTREVPRILQTQLYFRVGGNQKFAAAFGAIKRNTGLAIPNDRPGTVALDFHLSMIVRRLDTCGQTLDSISDHPFHCLRPSA